ncbi:MAG: hypothetical protein V4805_01415, partial [Pseudomonadota bacterium]
AASAQAATTGQQYLIDQLIQGGPNTIRNAAESIYQMHETDHAVLDVLAETLLQRYPSARDGDTVDAMSWACKGLAASGEKRYFDVVKEVADAPDTVRKLRKYCSRAAEDLRAPEGEQYRKGMASLKPSAATADASQGKKGNAKARAQSDKNASAQSITDVMVGMSMQQAYDIAGEPTDTNTYQTGKAFIPFNFRGKDLMRTAALYKGQGRIVFSNDSRYNGAMRVLEVIVNPNESGYP